MTNEAPAPLDRKARVRQSLAAAVAPTKSTVSMTSDLTIDEELNLHAVGWEPVELVTGLSTFSIPYAMWNWGQGEITVASVAHDQAFRHAITRLHHEAARAGGHGVVGVHVERTVTPTHIEISLLGTAVRPVGGKTIKDDNVFVSDLSARDFALLAVAGWEPLGLAAGASFVFAPRRSVSATLHQQTQNVELTNFTEALTLARETAMARMQEMALALKGTGVVEVKVLEGPMAFAAHAVSFTSWGTVVRASKSEHQLLHPLMVVPLDDSVVAVSAETLA